MSTGVIEVPLTGMEGHTRKTDRCKRKAWINVEKFGTLQRAEVGLRL